MADAQAKLGFQTACGAPFKCIKRGGCADMAPVCTMMAHWRGQSCQLVVQMCDQFSWQLQAMGEHFEIGAFSRMVDINRSARYQIEL